MLLWECFGVTADPTDATETNSAAYSGWHERGGNPASGILKGCSGGSWVTSSWINGARHLEGSNFLAADGHVKWLKSDNVCGGQTSGSATSSSCGYTSAQGAGYDGPTAAQLTMSPR